MASLAAADDASEKSLQSLFDPDQVGRLSTQLTRQQQEGERERPPSDFQYEGLLWPQRAARRLSVQYVFPYVILRS